MLKKIALYLLLFVVAALATAGGVVLFNKNPKQTTLNIQTEAEESSVLSSVVSAAMNIDNYKGTIAFSSTDKEIDMSGTFSVLDISKKPSGDILLSGKLFGENATIRVKYKNDYIYAKYNDFGIKIKASDLTDKAFINEMVETVSLFVSMQGPEISFDVDAIVASLAGIESKETKNGYSLQIKLPGIGDIYAETDKNYIPTLVEASDVSLLGKTFSLSLSGAVNTASVVTITSSEQNNYIDVSESKDLIVSVLRTIKSFPVELNGSVCVFGQSIPASIVIDKNFNVCANVKFANVSANIVYYKNELFADVCGLKLKGDIDDLSVLFDMSLGMDVGKLLATLNIDSTSFSIAGAKLLFEYDTAGVSKISIEHEFVEGSFDLIYDNVAEISKPAGYISAMSFQEAKEIIESYTSIFSANQISARLTGCINSNINFNLATYIKHEEFSLQELYVGGDVFSKSLYAYYKDGNAYLSVDETKVKLSNAFLSDIIEYISSLLGTQMPEVDFAEVAKQQISKLEIDKGGNIHIVLECGLFVEIMAQGENKLVVLKGKLVDVDIDASLAIYKKGNYFERAYKMLRPELYTDISSMSSTIKSVANTLTSASSCFKGDVSVDLIGMIKLKIGVELEIGDVTKGLNIKLKLSNLPSTCLITDTTAFKYKSQRMELEFVGDSVTVKRYGVKKKSEDLRFNKTYNISSLSTNDIFDMFGIGGMFGGEIRKAANSAGSSSATTNNISEIISLLKIQNGLLAQLNSSSLPSALKMAKVWFDTANEQINSINAFVLTQKSLVRVSMCLKKV